MGAKPYVSIEREQSEPVRFAEREKRRMKRNRKAMKKNKLFAAVALLSAAIAMPACDDDDNDGFREITNGNTYSSQNGKSDGFVKGADVSWLTEMEDNGVKFYSADGTETECMTLLKSLGTDAIRLRVWVNPEGGYCDKADLVKKAVRAHRLGLSLMVDFHYSDSWADPEKQNKPAAWADYSFDELKQAVADHTTEILTELKSLGITPAWAQIGNEVGDGLLWPDGRASINADRFATLVTSGIEAAKAVFPEIKTIVHVQNGWNNQTTNWIMGVLQKYDVPYDIFGVSLYPSLAIQEMGSTMTATGAVTLTLNNLETLAKQYDKEMMVCEFGYAASDPSTGYECLKMLTDAGKESSAISGVFYWEPECYNWKDYAMGAFSDDGTPLHTLDAYAE